MSGGDVRDTPGTSEPPSAAVRAETPSAAVSADAEASGRPAGPSAAPAGEQKRRPLWRSPWTWGFVAGLVFVTVMTPRTRYVPDPPRVIATLPAEGWRAADASTTTPWAEAVTVLGFLGESPDGCPDPVPVLRKLQIAYAQAEIPLTVTTAVVPRAGEPAGKAVARAIQRQGGERAGWRHVVLDEPDEVAARLVGRGADVGTCDLGGLPRLLTIVDRSGGARGVYPVRGPEVLSEVYHRSQHVSLSGGDSRDESPE